MTYRISKVNKYVFIDDTETGLRHESLVNASVTSSTEESTVYYFRGFNGFSSTKAIDVSDLTDSEGVVFTNETWKTFYTKEIAGFSRASASGAEILRHASSYEGGGDDLVFSQDIETMLPIRSEPFKVFNDEGKFFFDTANDWIDVSGINPNAWIVIRLSFLGVGGDADMIPSIRFINDKTDLNTYISIHGQQSKQKNGRLSSYIIEGYHGGAEVIQLYLETDKAETIEMRSITIKIEDVN